MLSATPARGPVFWTAAQDAMRTALARTSWRSSAGMYVAGVGDPGLPVGADRDAVACVWCFLTAPHSADAHRAVSA